MKSKYSTEDWSELDSAAKANLSAHDQAEFVRYKEQLRREGHAWDNDAHDILAGFIWIYLGAKLWISLGSKRVRDVRKRPFATICHRPQRISPDMLSARDGYVRACRDQLYQ